MQELSGALMVANYLVCGCVIQECNIDIDYDHDCTGFVGETATFIAECSEDENDLVIKESFKLKEAVESVAGKIDGL